MLALSTGMEVGGRKVLYFERDVRCIAFGEITFFATGERGVWGSGGLFVPSRWSSPAGLG